MKRYVCWLALLGVGAVPDWASAFNRRCGSGPVYYEPVYYAPVYHAPPVYYYPPPCLPVYVPVPCPPAAAATPKAAKPADPTRPMPPGETVRPAGGVSLPLTTPTAAPEFKPAAPPRVEPPAAEPPKTDAPKLEIPKFEPPRFDGPKSPAPDAAPAPAPALSLPPVTPEPGPLIPPPNLPVVPDAKKVDALPPLVLPPESPVRPTTAKSSPLSGGMTVKTYAASGRPTADGLNAVGFYNHTARDLDLTIEGKGVKLPAKSYLTARLGASFRWKHGDNPTETATVPADAVGLDVVFRE